MSYSIAIIQSPVDADDATAWAYVNEHAERLSLDETPSPALRELHADLTTQFPCICDLPEDEFEDGVWSDGPLIHNFGQTAAVLSFVFSSVDRVLPFIVQTANEHGMTVFDWQTEIIHRPTDLVLSPENEPPVRNPSNAQLDAVLERLTPNGGPGFAVFETTSQYIQVAGGDGEYTVEWREYDDRGFRHFVAGKTGATTPEIQILTNGFSVPVNNNERLELADVKTLFHVFNAGGVRPTAYEWRDVTTRF